MKYRFLQALGSVDAALCAKLGASLAKKGVAAGEVVDLPPKAAEYLSKRYPALLEPIQGVSPPAAIQAVPPKAADYFPPVEVPANYETKPMHESHESKVHGKGKGK